MNNKSKGLAIFICFSLLISGGLVWHFFSFANPNSQLCDCEWIKTEILLLESVLLRFGHSVTHDVGLSFHQDGKYESFQKLQHHFLHLKLQGGCSEKELEVLGQQIDTLEKTLFQELHTNYQQLIRAYNEVIKDHSELIKDCKSLDKR